MTRSSERSIWAADATVLDMKEVVQGVLYGGALFRLGAYCPKAMFPSNCVVVWDHEIVEYLRRHDVPLERVRFLVTTLPGTDWQKWNRPWDIEIREIKKRLDEDENDAVFVPYDDLPDLRPNEEFSATHLVNMLRNRKRRMKVTEKPDLWLVGAKGFPDQRLQKGDVPAALENVAWGSLTHQIPRLFPNMIYVEEPLRRLLDKAAYPGSIAWKEVKVAGA